MFKNLLLSGLVSGVVLSCQTAPKAPDYSQLAREHAREGLWQESLEYLKLELEAKPGSPAVHRNIGIVYVNLSQYTKGRKHLEKAARFYPRDYELNFYLAEAYRALRQFDKAIYAYQTAMNRRPESTTVKKALAWSYFKIRYFAMSIEIIHSALKIDPGDDQAMVILIRNHIEMNNVKEAQRVLRRYQPQVGEDTRPFFASMEGDIFFALGDMPKAKAMYRRALKSQPLLPSALLGLGKVLVREGKVEHATKFLQRAARIRPHLSEVHYYLAKAFEGRDKKKSMRYYRRFYKQAMNDPTYISKISETRERLRNLSQGDQPRAR